MDVLTQSLTDLSAHRRIAQFDQDAFPITSNLPFDEWMETFGSEPLTVALLNRRTHHVSILEVNGYRHRLAKSKARQNS